MKSLVERIVTKGKIIESDRKKLPQGVLCRVTYPICNVGERNANGRIYERDVWDKVLANEELQDKLSRRKLFGHAEHPEETQSNLEKTSHVIIGMDMNESDNKVYQTFDVLDTPYGNIVNTLLLAECEVGVSTRAEGDLEEAEDDNGTYQRVIPEAYHYVTTDFTADESTYGAIPVKVERDIVKTVKKGMADEKIEKSYAVTLLEHLKGKEAKALLEAVQKEGKATEAKVTYSLTEEQYKSDADIAAEFKGMDIKKIEVKPSGDSGYIEVAFPEGGEHVGGGTDYVVDHWIKYDSGKIAFDNWYPDDVYHNLVAAIEDKLSSGTDEGKDAPGKRDGSGPAKGSYQDKTKGKGKRKEAGEKCPNESVEQLDDPALLDYVKGLRIKIAKFGTEEDTWSDEEKSAVKQELVDVEALIAERGLEEAKGEEAEPQKGEDPTAKAGKTKASTEAPKVPDGLEEHPDKDDKSKSKATLPDGQKAEETKVAESYRLVVSDIDAGGGTLIDLYYDEDTQTVKEVKTVGGEEIGTFELRRDEFDPEVYGEAGKEFLRGIGEAKVDEEVSVLIGKDGKKTYRATYKRKDGKTETSDFEERPDAEQWLSTLKKDDAEETKVDDKTPEAEEEAFNKETEAKEKVQAKDLEKSDSIILAELKAERDTALEAVDRSDASRKKLEQLVLKINANLEKLQLEHGSIKNRYQKATELRDLERIKTLEETVKERLELVEQYKNEIAELSKVHEVELIKKYATTVLKITRLEISESQLTLLAACKSEEEVDQLLEELRGVIQEGMLHSGIPGSIIIDREHSQNPSEAVMKQTISTVMEGMTGKLPKRG